MPVDRPNASDPVRELCRGSERFTAMKKLSAVALFAASVLCTASLAGAAPFPLSTLATVPESTLGLAYITGGDPAGGYAGPNQGQWQSVAFQRGAMDKIDHGVIKNDPALIDKWWPFLDVAFQHQRPDGGFEYASVIDGHEQLPVNQFGGDSFWLGESEVALLMVRSSPLAPRYQARIDALVPKYRLALEYLAANKASLMKTDFNARMGSGATNRLFADAEAFLLGDLLIGGTDPSVKQAGEEFLSLGLQGQAPEGYFVEKGGPDSSYNAGSCLRLAEISLFLNDPRIQPALDKSVDWELTQLKSDGQIDASHNTRTNGQEMYHGKVKTVNYSGVDRMLVLDYGNTGDPKILAAATNIANYYHATTGK
jgi:hypothetical protein